MEQLYSDFVSKVLPKIQEGLAMTKDYFMDLAGRYIKYLIITDGIYLVLFLVMFIVSLYILLSKKILAWVHKGDRNSDYYTNDRWGIYIGTIIALVISIGGVLYFTNNLVKDIFIPEIRIMEELRPFIGK